MEQRVFEKFRDLIYEKSGITLGPQKVSLVSARIAKRMRTLSIEKHEDYLKYVLQDESGDELIQLLDCISTNVTSFFRESQHFDFLSSVLSAWRAKGQSRYRLWCAASSTGEEPYSIAMIASEALKMSPCDVRILATDISTRVLELCLRGHYPEARVEPVPRALRDRYFRKSVENAEKVFIVADELRRLITFRRLNLATPPFPMRGPLDVIFCRNVMIYFDDQVRSRLIEEAYRLLRPGGYFIVGHSESLTRCNSKFQIVQPSIYQKQ